MQTCPYYPFRERNAKKDSLLHEDRSSLWMTVCLSNYHSSPCKLVFLRSVTSVTSFNNVAQYHCGTEIVNSQPPGSVPLWWARSSGGQRGGTERGWAAERKIPFWKLPSLSEQTAVTMTDYVQKILQLGFQLYEASPVRGWKMIMSTWAGSDLRINAQQQRSKSL